MNDKSLKKCCLWTIAVLYTLWIFHNSCQPGSSSANLSGGIARRLFDHIDFLQIIPFETFHTILRKSAHFTEYFILGTMICCSAAQSNKNRRTAILLGWMILTPIIDESIQLFTPGRSAEITDCLLDMCGYICGWFMIHQNQKRKNSG